MKLAGTPDDGWIAIDLEDVARAIATVRSATPEGRSRTDRAAQETCRSEPGVPARA